MISTPIDSPNASTTVAVIGAGVGGLVAARTLVDHGYLVTIFDKSRGVGGRLATRRGEDQVTFDHGASCFTASDQRFAQAVDRWIQDGVAQNWDADMVSIDSEGTIRSLSNFSSRPRQPFVGVPTNNSIAKHLAAELNVLRGRRIVCVSKKSMDQSDRWQLSDETGQQHGPFDAIICNMPVDQTSALVHRDVTWSTQLADRAMSPCWTLMLVCEMKPPSFEVAFVEGPMIHRMVRQDTKPLRSKDRRNTVQLSTWVIQASARWSHEFLEQTPESVADLLTNEAMRLLGGRMSSVRWQRAHRWRFAEVAEIHATDQSEKAWFDPTTRWGVCGDWLGGGNVQGAYLSGQAVAAALMRHRTK